VLEWVRAAEVEHELLRNATAANSVGGGGGSRPEGGGDSSWSGWGQSSGSALWEQVEAAKLAVEARVVSNGNMRLYCGSLGESRRGVDRA
jgi:hypothetical protein